MNIRHRGVVLLVLLGSWTPVDSMNEKRSSSCLTALYEKFKSRFRGSAEKPTNEEGEPLIAKQTAATDEGGKSWLKRWFEKAKKLFFRTKPKEYRHEIEPSAKPEIYCAKQNGSTLTGAACQDIFESVGPSDRPIRMTRLEYAKSPEWNFGYHCREIAKIFQRSYSRPRGFILCARDKMAKLFQKPVLSSSSENPGNEKHALVHKFAFRTTQSNFKFFEPRDNLIFVEKGGEEISTGTGEAVAEKRLPYSLRLNSYRSWLMPRDSILDVFVFEMTSSWDEKELQKLSHKTTGWGEIQYGFGYSKGVN